MSCPSWRELAAWRDDPRAGEPAEWREALEHLDRGCPLCRRDAYAADPTLVFRRLAAVPEPTPAQEASDVEAMRRAVAAMRAASRVEAVERQGRPFKALNWKRWAAAAALAVAALSVPADDARRLPRQQQALVMPAVYAPGETLDTAAFAPASLDEDQPIVEGVNLPDDARLYHMEGEGLSVVMVVGETMGG